MKKVKYQAVEISNAASTAAGTYEHSITLDSGYDRCTGIILYDNTGTQNVQIGLDDKQGTILDLVHENLIGSTQKYAGDKRFLKLNFPVINGQALKIRQKLESAIGGSDVYTNIMFRLEKDEPETPKILNPRIRIQTLDFTLASGKQAGTWDFNFPLDSRYDKVVGINVENITSGSLSLFRTNYALYDSGKALLDPFMLYLVESHVDVNPDDKWLPVDIDIYDGMNSVVRVITKEATGSAHRSIIHALLEKL